MASTSRGVQINKQLPIGAHSNHSNLKQDSQTDLDSFKSWTKERVAEWLVLNDFGEYKDCFLQHEITGDLLLDLNYPSLKDIGVLIVGDRARILQAIKKSFSSNFTNKSVKSSAGTTSSNDSIPPQKRSVVSFAEPKSNEPMSASITTSREFSASNSIDFPTTESEKPSTRSSQKSRLANPLVIYPRSSSMKDAGAQKQTVSKEVLENFDSLFGNTSSSVSANKLTASGRKLLKEVSSANIASEGDDGEREVKDAMSIKTIRENCIRIRGPDEQAHIVRVVGLNSGAEIEDKIYTKFSINDPENWQLFMNENVVPISTNKLFALCQTDNEHRRNIYLRRMGGSSPSAPSHSFAIDKQSAKLQKFFGADVQTQKKDSLQKIFGKLSIAKENRKFSAFFGERPPDEMIVDQLEQFFPGIEIVKDARVDASENIKNIVQANFRKKRSSNRQSSLMIRRQTKNIASVHLKLNRESALEKKEPSSKLAHSIFEEPTPMEKPAPINFRWAPGRIIGQGAFGKVIHALNLDTGEFMAVKQVVDGMESQQKKSTDSLQREIDLLKDLDHENIVRYLGFEISEDSFNVFLEYVSGGSISSCIAKCGKFAPDIARSFAAQILCGLEYLHSRDIVHRDIKGANVLITGEGIAKITDFGISKKNEYAAYHRMTRMSMQGSVYWMAPEQARGKGYSAKVDIWSCGCLVLEMLTGHVPWHKVRGNVLYLLGTGNSPPIPDDLSDSAKTFLTESFTLDPEKRPTASILLDHSFTDIDPFSVDFVTWSQDAAQRRLEEGTTSEEKSDSEEDFEEEEDLFDYDGIEDDEDEEVDD